MATNFSKKYLVHFWVPNLFEFKGGIQVYLSDILLAVEHSYRQNEACLKVVVIDKLDRGKPTNVFDVGCFSFMFTGQYPKVLQIFVFSLKALAIAFLNRPNLILCGHLNFSPVAHFLYRWLGIPYWILVYGVDAWNVKNRLQCQALHAAERVISISGYTRDRLVQEQNLSFDKISLLPVTFNVDRFQIKSKPICLLDRHGLEAGQPVILTVARLAGEARHKGYDQILKALPEIRRHIPDVHYVLVGKGCDKSRVEKLINALHLDDCVTLTGFVPDREICDYYNLCDVFAMPSKGEGFGIVYLEALACGKPTVGGNQDGAVDALCDGELGVLVDPDNLTEIASTLVEILQGKSSHPILYQPKVLRQSVEAIYGFEKFQANLMDLIKQSNLVAS